MPKDLQLKVRGDVDCHITKTGMLCLHWYDKRLITMLSTVHNSELVTTSNRHRRQRLKLCVVVDYIVGMKELDLSGKLAHSYPTPRKSIKWTTKVLYKLTQITIVNSFLVHKALGGTLTQRAFRRELVRDLLRISTGQWGWKVPSVSHAWERAVSWKDTMSMRTWPVSTVQGVLCM